MHRFYLCRNSFYRHNQGTEPDLNILIVLTAQFRKAGLILLKSLRHHGKYSFTCKQEPNFSWTESLVQLEDIVIGLDPRRRLINANQEAISKGTFFPSQPHNASPCTWPLAITIACNEFCWKVCGILLGLFVCSHSNWKFQNNLAWDRKVNWHPCRRV